MRIKFIHNLVDTYINHTINDKTKKIPIFLATDENYAPYACATMYSILKNTKSNIEFNILDGGISTQSKKNIKSSLKTFKNFSIKYHDMSKYCLNRFPEIRHYSINAFSRYFIPQISPDLEKALYLDVDIIVTGDITELYSQDLGGYPLAAVLEDFYEGNYTYLKENIYKDYKGNDQYFNSGVLLLDVQKFNQNNYTEKLIKLTTELFDKLATADQDVFNILFENNFKILDYKYNLMPDYVDILKLKHPNTKIDPIVIHYTGFKPWKSEGPMDDKFWEIANKTKFYKKNISIYKSIKENNCIKRYFLGLPYYEKYNDGEYQIKKHFGNLFKKKKSSFHTKYYLLGIQIWCKKRLKNK